MWGQAIEDLRLTGEVGIIPTRVGTSPRRVRAEALNRDHPHACGDKLVCLSIRIFSRGSSPRVWGQGKRKPTVFKKWRIIPTRVGTSTLRLVPFLSFQDHPHACGDKLPDEFVLLNDLGSSPRVWGQVVLAYCLVCKHRIIPTRVGTRKYSFKF